RGDYVQLAFSPDGKVLASLSQEGLLRLEEIRSGDELLRHRFGGTGLSPGIAFSPDGSTLAVATGAKLFAWRWREGREPAAFGVRASGITSLAFAPDGKTLATSDDRDGCVHLWDVANTKRLKTLDTKSSSWAVSYSPDSKYLASTTYKDRALILW